MKMLWCWRCRQDMPMLDEAEYAEVDRLYSVLFSVVKTIPAMPPAAPGDALPRRRSAVAKLNATRILRPHCSPRARPCICILVGSISACYLRGRSHLREASR